MVHSSAINLGMGFGVPLINCRFSEKTFATTKGIFIFEAPGLFSVKLPYVATVSSQGTKAPTSVGSWLGKHKIVLTKNNTGTAIIFRGDVVYDGYPSRSTIDQRSYKTCSSVVHTVDGSIDMIRGSLTIKNVPKIDGVNLDNFITNTLEFNEYPFSIEVFDVR